MATSAVSNLSIYQELQNFYQDRRADVRQLGHALQSGDLNQAQQVYEALAALGQSGPFANSEPFSKNRRAQAFDAIGQALQAGNLGDAQAAFANLQQTFGKHENAAHQIPAFVVNIGATLNAGVSSNVSDPASIYQQRQDFRQQRRDGLDQLGKALQAGDAEAAQKAYDALVALGQNGPLRNGKTFQRSDRAQDFAAIGQALQSGDLAGAQQAFSALANTFGHQGPAPLGPPTPAPPPPPTPVSTAPPPEPPIIATPSGPPEILINVGGTTETTAQPGEIVVNVGNNAGSNGPEEVQINFGNGSSAGHLTIDVNQGQNGQAGEEITLNFNPGNTNYQLVLNLFGAGANSQPTGSLNLQA